jgi:CTD kinase subunit alpha
MLEIFTRRTTFAGNDEIHQLETIYATCGTPLEAEWPGLNELPWYELLRKPDAPLPNRLKATYGK